MKNAYKEYKNQFCDYIKNELFLEKYDVQIANDSLKYIMIPDKYKREYQKNNPLGLKYIYLRNEFHFERLTEDQKKLLSSETSSSDIMQLIKDTCENIISPREIISDDDRRVRTFYDNAFYPDFVNMNSLVLMIGTYPEFDAQGEMVDNEKEIIKSREIQTFAKQMELELKDKLGIIPIRVFARR